MFLEEMKTIRLKDQQGLFLLQAVKILLEGFGALTAKSADSRSRVPRVSRHFPGTVPNAVDTVWYFSLLRGPLSPNCIKLQAPQNLDPPGPRHCQVAASDLRGCGYLPFLMEAREELRMAGAIRTWRPPTWPHRLETSLERARPLGFMLFF